MTGLRRIVQFYLKGSVWQRLYDGTFQFNQVLFWHLNFLQLSESLRPCMFCQAPALMEQRSIASPQPQRDKIKSWGLRAESPRSPIFSVGREGQNDRISLGDCDGILVVRRQLAVCRLDGPTVRQYILLHTFLRLP